MPKAHSLHTRQELHIDYKCDKLPADYPLKLVFHLESGMVLLSNTSPLLAKCALSR